MTLTDMIPSLRTSIPPRLEPGIWPETAALLHGDVAVGSVPLRDIASRYGTPTYVVDEDDVRSRCRYYRRIFTGGEVAYASKAFLSRTMADWINQEALSLDVSSSGELAVARAVDFPADRIILHGLAKPPDLLHAAMDFGVGRIVIDGMSEIPRISALARRRQRVLVRVAPGIDAGTHSAVTTGTEDTQFGLPISTGAAAEALHRVLNQPSLELAGLHCHLGSQITDAAAYEVAVRRLLGLARQVWQEHRVAIHELNLGGGHGIAYAAGDRSLDVGELAVRLRSAVHDECRTRSLAVPRITVEPGRAIIGRSAVAVYRVIAIKHARNEKTFVAVDGGMSDNPRPALYGSAYTVRMVGRPSCGRSMTVTVVGRHCETGDVLARDISLPADLRPGDLLAIPCSGAYQIAMSSNYNLAHRPAVVAVYGGRTRTLIRRETDADLLSRDIRST